MTRHLLRRWAFFALGIVLFYAPFAVVTRGLLAWTGDPLIADVHRICLRMPFEWLSQPWMYPALIGNVLNLVGLVVLPVVAFVVGPLFCGWLCPAGAFTELLGRLLPDRFKLSLGGYINPTPIRYGVLIGMLLSPFAGGYVCCTYCNFTMMQNLVSAAAGDPVGVSAWASFTILTFLVWFLLLGLLVKGGRGWCNLICPAGAVQGLAHAWGAKLGFSRAIRHDPAACSACGRCAEQCPAWALSKHGEVNYHACNLCRDCLFVCPRGALRYGTRGAVGIIPGDEHHPTPAERVGAAVQCPRDDPGDPALVDAVAAGLGPGRPGNRGQ